MGQEKIATINLHVFEKKKKSARQKGKEKREEKKAHKSLPC